MLSHSLLVVIIVRRWFIAVEALLAPVDRAAMAGPTAPVVATALPIMGTASSSAGLPTRTMFALLTKC